MDRPSELESPAAAKKRVLCGGSTSALEKVLKFGRELQLFYLRLRSEQGESDYNKNLLQVCAPEGGGGRGASGFSGGLVVGDPGSVQYALCTLL